MSKSLAGSIVVAMLLISVPVTAAQWWRFGSGKHAVEFQRFQAPGNSFSLEIPTRDWQIVPGAGTVEVVFAQSKGEASVAIDHMVMKTALAPDDITQLFADLEVEHVKQRDTGVHDVSTSLRTEADGQRLIVISYGRTGMKGPEEVKQYSLPFGADLFRLICSASPEDFPKYADEFEHMAESFRVKAVSTTGAK